MIPHRTLFIAPTRIGDAVLATSLLAHIAATSPQTRVTIATSPLAAPLFEGFPQLECIITMTKRTYNRHWLGVWAKTIGTHWGAIWDVRNSILSFTLRARQRHRFTRPGIIEPKVKQYERALATGPLPHPALWPRAGDVTTAETLVPTAARYLVFAPIANWAPKEWPMEHFITLTKILLDGTCKGYRPIIICAGHERAKAKTLLEALANYHPIDLTDGTAHLLTIYAVMQRAHGFIGNDSGLMHMAAASGIPTLGLFGPTPSMIYQPWGACTTFLQAQGDDLNRLTPESVAQTFQSLLAS